MHITIDEAAAICARVSVAWYGNPDRALRIVRQQVEVLGKRGDESGVEAWTKVAAELERMNCTDRNRKEMG